MSNPLEEDEWASWSRTCFQLSNWLGAVFTETYGRLFHRVVSPYQPGKFQNATTKTEEAAVRTLIVLSALAAIVFAGTYLLSTAILLSAGSKAMRWAGFALQKHHYTHIQGQAKEASLSNQELTIMSWKLPIKKGSKEYENGLMPWPFRFDAIVENIRQSNAHVVLLHGITDEKFLELLCEKLKEDFSHFFIYLHESDCAILCRCSVASFIHRDFSKTDEDLQRAFEVLELQTQNGPCARVIAAKLSPQPEKASLREEQLEQILAFLEKETEGSLPTVFVGAVPKQSKERDQHLFKKIFYRTDLDLDLPPRNTDDLANQWKEGSAKEKVDSTSFIGLVKRSSGRRILPIIERGVTLESCEQGWAFDQELPDPNKAVSDEKPILNTLRLSEIKA